MTPATIALPPVSSVAAMEGRELDKALHDKLFEECIKPCCEGDIPWYSTSEGPSFFAMVKAVRENHWRPSILDEGGENPWGVILIHIPSGACVDAEADALPLAFARAALLTCYSNGGQS